VHLDQAPGLGYRFPHDRDSGRSQPGVLGMHITDPDPDHHRTAGRAGRMPGDLKQSLAEEEHQPGIVRRPELPGIRPGRAGHGRSGDCGPGRRGAPGSGCSERQRHHSSITLSDTGSRGERAQCRRYGAIAGRQAGRRNSTRVVDLSPAAWQGLPVLGVAGRRARRQVLASGGAGLQSRPAPQPAISREGPCGGGRESTPPTARRVVHPVLRTGSHRPPGCLRVRLPSRAAPAAGGRARPARVTRGRVRAGDYL
jgi:hypothetical protein